MQRTGGKQGQQQTNGSAKNENFIGRQLRHNAHYSVSVQQTVHIPIKFVHKKPLKPIIRYIYV